MKTTIRLSLTLLSLLIISPGAVAADQERAAVVERDVYLAPRQAGVVRSPALAEISGMAGSRYDKDILWVHNDSGAGPHLYPLRTDGTALGRVRVADATSRDWEDMAAFNLAGDAYLIVGDIGDNNARRKVNWLHVVREPKVPIGGFAKGTRLPISWSVPFVYPPAHGPADCEALAIDEENGLVLLLTKRSSPPRLYSVPLKPDGAQAAAGKLHEARFIANVATIPKPTPQQVLENPLQAAYGSQPTAMDFDGERLLVLTYNNAYAYRKHPDQSWAEAVAAKPATIRLPVLRQAEAIAYDKDGTYAYVTSEHQPAPIYRLQRLITTD